jgi:mono/diheme cytochrome c family protein
MSDRTFSVLGLFDSARLLMAAIPEVKARVRGRLEAYTPYPIHGMDEALGLRKSPVGGMVFAMALVGALSVLGFELWTAGVDYPLITAGKPVWSWEAYIPVMFEVMVLFGCFTAGLGMLLLLNRLPSFRHPMLQSRAMPLITRDKFALAVEADGQPLDVAAIIAALRDAGAGAVEVLERPAPVGPVPARFLLRLVLGTAVSCLAAGYLTYWGVKLFPVAVPMVHMLDQPRLDPQRASAFFPDGSGMRLPVAGTVARGHLPYAVPDRDAAAAVANPLPRTERVLRQGKRAFVTYCSVCHGILGNGIPTLTAAYGAKPANLVARTIRDDSDGTIHHAIVMGRNAMPAYAVDLTEDEGWAVVHYVRVLQRALNARDEDLPKEVAR